MKREGPHSSGEACAVRECPPHASVDGDAPVLGKLPPTPTDHSLSGLNAAMETQWALWARAVSAMLAAATSCTGLFRGMEGTPDPGTVPGTSPSSTRVHAAKDLEIDSKLHGAGSAESGGGHMRCPMTLPCVLECPSSLPAHKMVSKVSDCSTGGVRGVRWCAVVCSGGVR